MYFGPIPNSPYSIADLTFLVNSLIDTTINPCIIHYEGETLIMNKQTDFKTGPLAGKNYDRFEQAMPWYNEIEELLATTLAAKLRGIKDPQVLELGCGTGLTTEKIMKHVPNCHLVAIDSSRRMIIEARKRVRSKNITWMHTDATEYVCKAISNNYDAVVSAFMIHNLTPEQRRMLFKGICNVVRIRGGWFINADKYARNNEAKHLADLADQLLHFDVFNDDPAYRLKWTVHYLLDEKIRFTEKDQIDLLRNVDVLNHVTCRFTFRRRMEALFSARIITE